MAAVVGLAVLAGAVFAHGYHFPASNHHTLLTPLQAFFDLALYPVDYYTDEMGRFTVRTFYLAAVAGPMYLGLSADLTLFLYYAAALASVVLGLRAIGRTLTGSEFGAVALSFLGLAAVVGTLGGITLFPRTSLPDALAMGFAIWGLCFSLKGRWGPALTLFGLAAILQLLVGLMPALMVTPWYLRHVWLSALPDGLRKDDESGGRVIARKLAVSRMAGYC